MSDDDLPIISIEEVAQHNGESEDGSCWIIISGKVYDVTSFLQEHPGGEEVITQMAGQDATTEFFDAGHSKDAIEMAKEYLIGKLPENEKVNVESTAPVPVVKSPVASSSVFKDFMASPVLANILIPTTIGLGVYAVYKCVTRSNRVC
ncbi:hypothetical protein CAEBREN_18686 [Caenorhabditis brenneri]|uniref:Cytochrome b5 heme-binding domain-containing protein n=1 Tax=Caenorhabditis brenneri TaxID=135651 RepID=G0NB28_CAEBE|nr:hypothetical protein CAEBREN_18686 [Caenorhabditis brenneri]